MAETPGWHGSEAPDPWTDRCSTCPFPASCSEFGFCKAEVRWQAAEGVDDGDDD